MGVGGKGGGGAKTLEGGSQKKGTERKNHRAAEGLRGEQFSSLGPNEGIKSGTREQKRRGKVLV